MADFPIYTTLEEKAPWFANGNDPSFIIDSREKLDKLFKDVDDIEHEENKRDVTALIYRGLTEAKFKLLTSAQRLWISNEMNQWAAPSFLAFANNMVQLAKKSPLIKRVFDLYGYTSSEREFPILSLLQHYGAPTPLMDWTYNNNVAFYFATEGVSLPGQPKTSIDDYFSVYRINKSLYRNELMNLKDFMPKKFAPPLDSFFDSGDASTAKQANGIFYISDFESRRGSTTTLGFRNMKVRSSMPLTVSFPCFRADHN